MTLPWVVVRSIIPEPSLLYRSLFAYDLLIPKEHPVGTQRIVFTPLPSIASPLHPQRPPKHTRTGTGDRHTLLHEFLMRTLRSRSTFSRQLPLWYVKYKLYLVRHYNLHLPNSLLPVYSQVQDLLQNEQHNSVMLAYGITAAGKTYTIEGTKQQPGVMPRTLEMLFQGLDNHVEDICVRVAYYEVVVQHTPLLWPAVKHIIVGVYFIAAECACRCTTSRSLTCLRTRIWVLGSIGWL